MGQCWAGRDTVRTSKLSTSAPQKIALLLLCGLPASGKSTLARELEYRVREANANLPSLFPGPFSQCVHVEFDEFPGDFHQQRASARAKIERELTFATVRQDSTLIICDDNNFYRSMRRDFVQLCNQITRDSVCCVLVYCKIPPELALERNLQRARTRVTAETIVKMNAQFDIPLPRERAIVIDSAHASVRENATAILQALYTARQQQQQKVVHFPIPPPPPPPPMQQQPKDLAELLRKKEIAERVLAAKQRGVSGRELNKIALGL